MSVLCPEPRTQDSRGGPDDEDEEERCPTHSGAGDEEEEGEEEGEALQWRGPGEYIHTHYFQ